MLFARACRASFLPRASFAIYMGASMRCEVGRSGPTLPNCYLLDLVAHVPSLRVVTAKSTNLLTPRAEQVVALVGDGMSNREVVVELGLREHTIKTYLFRIFEKLGISSRVELVLYAMNNGTSRAAEWIPGSATALADRADLWSRLRRAIPLP